MDGGSTRVPNVGGVRNQTIPEQGILAHFAPDHVTSRPHVKRPIAEMSVNSTALHTDVPAFCFKSRNKRRRDNNYNADGFTSFSNIDAEAFGYNTAELNKHLNFIGIVYAEDNSDKPSAALLNTLILGKRSVWNFSGEPIEAGDWVAASGPILEDIYPEGDMGVRTAGYDERLKFADNRGGHMQAGDGTFTAVNATTVERIVMNSYEEAVAVLRDSNVEINFHDPDPRISEFAMAKIQETSIEAYSMMAMLAYLGVIQLAPGGAAMLKNETTRFAAIMKNVKKAKDTLSTNAEDLILEMGKAFGMTKNENMTEAVADLLVHLYTQHGATFSAKEQNLESMFSRATHNQGDKESILEVLVEGPASMDTKLLVGIHEVHRMVVGRALEECSGSTEDSAQLTILLT